MKTKAAKKQKDKFKKGDLVRSSALSKDKECFGKEWHAIILEVRNHPKSVPFEQHLGCYETLGWFGKDRTTQPTLRQLWGVHLDADDSELKVEKLKVYVQ